MMQYNTNSAQQALQAGFDVQHAASRGQGEVTWALRRQRLMQLLRMLRENQADIVAAINTDFGQRATAETLMAEFFPAVSGIQHALKHGKRWMAVRRMPTGLWFLPARSAIRAQPLGVVGVMAPWNYPLYLVVGPLTDALVAGNRVMIKVSEYAPAFAHWLAKAVPRYFAADEVLVVEGDADIGAAFSALPFDHLFFTGSTAVGHRVMQAASRNLTPVTLELGGKSPVFIAQEADLAHAVDRIMVGKLLNAGQTCVAPDYVLLPEAQIAPFIALAKRWVARHYPDIATGQDYSRIINERQYQRLQQWLAEAESSGAMVTPLCQAKADEATRFLPPQLVSGASPDSALLQYEIFGPVLPLLTYTSIDDAVNQILQRPRPLAFYIFSQQDAEIADLLQRVVAGGVTVNDTIYHVAQTRLPFGGVGHSGMGACHGKAGFETFSHLQPVFYQSRWSGVGVLRPPYRRGFRAMIKLLLR